jgi:hypothetical protein
MAEDTTVSQPIPDGMMRVWDPQQKKVILVSAPPAPDHLTLTIRLHDPKEKQNAALAASWVVIQVDRVDMALAPEEFAAKYLLGAVAQLEHFKPKP